MRDMLLCLPAARARFEGATNASVAKAGRVQYGRTGNLTALFFKM